MSILLPIILAAAGLVALGVMFTHPAGTTLALLAITPFEGVPTYYLGLLGNLLTLAPILIFLARLPPTRWLDTFLGTRLQLAALAFLLLSLISHAIAADVAGPGAAAFSYGRKIVLFMLIGMFGSAFASDRYVGLCMKTIVVSTVGFTFLSMLDFYFGIRLLPGTIDAASLEGAAGVELDAQNVGYLRFRGVGLPVNRTANWLILPAFLAAGWWMARGSLFARAISIGSLAILLGGILGTVGRSALLGVAVGAVILLPLALRRFGQIWGLLSGALALLVGMYILTLFVDFTEILTYRFEEDQTEGSQVRRVTVWGSALDLFLRSPVVGIGADIVHVKSAVKTGAHNISLKILAEAGVIGFIPFAALFGFTLWNLTRNVGRAAPEVEYWRPFVFAGFIALLVQNQFNAYPWERFLWVCIAYAAAVERCAMLQYRMPRMHALGQTDGPPGATAPPRPEGPTGAPVPH